MRKNDVENSLWELRHLKSMQNQSPKLKTKNLDASDNVSIKDKKKSWEEKLMVYDQISLLLLLLKHHLRKRRFSYSWSLSNQKSKQWIAFFTDYFADIDDVPLNYLISSEIRWQFRFIGLQTIISRNCLSGRFLKAELFLTEMVSFEVSAIMSARVPIESASDADDTDKVENIFGSNNSNVDVN